MAKKRNGTKALKTVMESITTLHGTVHLTKKKGKNLVMWSMLMIANIIVTICFIIMLKTKYNDDQIITQINANCKVSQAPFPAVSICNFNVVSLRETKNIEQLLLHYNRNQSEINGFFRDLPYLIYYGTNSTQVGHYNEIMDILKHHYFTVDIFMEELHQKCENLLLYCTYNRKQKKCSEIFNLIKTVEGFCCTFNYAGLNDGSEENILTKDDSFEYYDEDTEDKAPTFRIIATSESGKSSGLYVIFDVEPEDYPSYATIPYYGAKLIISDPNDYPETRLLYKYIGQGESIDFKLEPNIFQTDPQIRTVDISKRRCWFHDEVVLDHTDRYSFETCSTECRIKTLLEYCGCVPYKYPKKKFDRICEFQDLKCLNNVTVHKSFKPMDCKPSCYMECSDKMYLMTSNRVRFTHESLPTDLRIDGNASQLSSLRVFYRKSSCNCYKLNLYIDLNYIIATFGGIFSISFGGSLLTVIELTYLLISATLILILRVYKKVYEKQIKN